MGIAGNEALRVGAALLVVLGPGVVVLGTKPCWRRERVTALLGNHVL